jgi:hypothetical protein
LGGELAQAAAVDLAVPVAGECVEEDQAVQL